MLEKVSLFPRFGVKFGTPSQAFWWAGRERLRKRKVLALKEITILIVLFWWGFWP